MHTHFTFSCASNESIPFYQKKATETVFSSLLFVFLVLLRFISPKNCLNLKFFRRSSVCINRIPSVLLSSNVLFPETGERDGAKAHKLHNLDMDSCTHYRTRWKIVKKSTKINEKHWVLCCLITRRAMWSEASIVHNVQGTAWLWRERDGERSMSNVRENESKERTFDFNLSPLISAQSQAWYMRRETGLKC